jgi:hypothetical protein
MASQEIPTLCEATLPAVEHLKGQLKEMSDEILEAIMTCDGWENPTVTAAAIGLVAGTIASVSADPDEVLGIVLKIAKTSMSVQGEG